MNNPLIVRVKIDDEDFKTVQLQIECLYKQMDTVERIIKSSWLLRLIFGVKK
jgi:hypothetical protein